MHGIAANYHWSEREIMALPFVRLKAYQRVLLKEQGQVVMDDEPYFPEVEELRLAMVEVLNNGGREA